MLFQSRHFFGPSGSGSRTPLLSALAGVGSIALALLVSSSPAHAGGTHWSIGISSPGVVVGVGNGGYRGGAVYAPPAPRYYSAPPGYYAPPPVYYTPAPPVYYQPRPVYVPQPPVYFAPVARPIYYAPPVLVPAQRPYYGPGWRGQRHGERHHGYGYRD